MTQFCRYSGQNCSCLSAQFWHGQKSLTQIHYRIKGPRQIGPKARFCPDSVATKTLEVTPVTATDRKLAYAVLSRSEA